MISQTAGYVNANDAEFDAIFNNAYQHSILVQKALWQMQHYYSGVHANQNALLQQNNVLYANVKNNIDIPSLQSQTLERIDRDIGFVQQLNEALNAYPEPGEGDFTWSLATNKMEIILSGAKELILDDAIFTQILQGQVPLGYENSPPSVVFLGDTTGIYGNSKATYLSGAILEVTLSLLAQKTQVQDIHLQEDKNTWIDHAAIAHVTPIPELLDPNEVAPSFTDEFSYYFSDELTPQGFVYIHSGYAFGGQRLEARYPDGKDFGPEDCSSWIAKMTDSDILFSTIDLLYTYRMSFPEDKRGYVDSNWLTSDYAKTLETLSPVVVEDPLKDIHAGQVLAFRTFDCANHFNSSGLSGHTALVLGVRENGNVITINYGRNMPDVEGFGISEIPWASTEKKEVMFFEVKTKPILMEDVLGNELILGLEENSTHHVKDSLQHFDHFQNNFSSIENQLILPNIDPNMLM